MATGCEDNNFPFGSPIAGAPAHLTLLYFIFKIFSQFFLPLFQLFMTPHSSLNIVLDILVVRSDIGHQNNRTYGLSKVRAL